MITFNRKHKETTQRSGYVNLMVDVAFKRVFGQQASKELLIALLNSVLPELNITDLTYLNVEKPGSWRKAKKIVFDVLCDIGDGSKVIIEMQVVHVDHFRDRIIYYTSHEILSQHKEGDQEYKLLPIYVVSFVNFNLEHEFIKPGQIVWKYSLREDESHEKMSDALHYTFVELGRFNKTEPELANDEERFYFCIKHIHELKKRPENIAGEIFEKLFEKAKVAAMSEREYRNYLASMTTEADIRIAMNSAENRGRNEGLEQGRAEGEAQKALAIARNLKVAGMSSQAIAQATGLSLEEVEGL